ncbi:MAG: beta-ketoacyl-[acyl-carrier-protein] synthase family protein, partial [Candidatus Omnitrophica bacterium]|nr:beta-ketoacyl-[acyl-carrier-protein] synthase family protein [Candidatus Omnitrophota bacterium]
MERRIVITGLGVLASTGIGKNAFWEALKDGRSGMKPVSLFDTSTCRTRLGGEISDFKPEEILGQKGLRNLDRTTKLALCAAQLALDDSGIRHPLTEDETDEFGVSLGSTMGSVWSISEFDKEALRNGPRSVNPALFPNTVMNSPASHINIKFNIQGFSSTISTGFCSSIDAIYYAMNMLELYDYKVVLAGGVEEMCEQTYKGFHKIGHLAGSRPGKEEVNCPFDKRRNGIMFGEGSVIVILEELSRALKRNAKIYAEILGYGTCFDPKSRNIYSPKAEGATEAIKNCLDDAGIGTGDIGYISASGNSTLDCDYMETNAVKNVFGGKAKSVPMSSVKSMIGESFSASGALNLAASLGVFEEGFVPPTINYVKPDRRCDLDYVPNKSQKNRVKNILVNSFSPTGSNSTLTVRK